MGKLSGGLMCMLLEEERKIVIKTALKAQNSGLVPLTFGNFSIRDQKTGYVCITPSGIDYQDLQPQDIVVIDIEGKIIEGAKRPSVETPMHCHIYKKRPDVFGICHTHSTFATAWASCEESMPVIVAELAALIGGRVETAPYRPIGSIALAEVTAKVLADKAAVLMSNHGLVAVGPDLASAFCNAVIVEESAKVTFYAKNLGKIKVISEAECEAIKKWASEKYGQE